MGKIKIIGFLIVAYFIYYGVSGVVEYNDKMEDKINQIEKQFEEYEEDTN